MDPFQKPDPNQIMMQLACSLEKQLGIINFPLTVQYEESDRYYDTAVNIPEVSVQAFAVSDGTIAVGTESVTYGCHTMPNGDPGDPDDYEFNEEGSVPLYNYAKAVDMMLQLAVVGASRIVGDAAADQAMYEEWKKEKEEAV